MRTRFTLRGVAALLATVLVLALDAAVVGATYRSIRSQLRPVARLPAPGFLYHSTVLGPTACHLGRKREVGVRRDRFARSAGAGRLGHDILHVVAFFRPDQIA